MSITLNAGKNNTVTLGADGDLAKMLTPGINTIFHLDETLKDLIALPHFPLADAPAGTIEGAFGTDQTAKWDLNEHAKLTLSFKPEFGGSIKFTKPGPLLQCLDHERNPFPIAVPPEHIAVSISFHVTIGTSSGGAYSAGNLGIKASLTDNDQFLIANHRLFPATTELFAAVKQTFEEFRLPFLAGSVTSLPPDHILEFAFVGNLSLGCGITYGITTHLGENSASQLTTSIDHDFAKATIKAAPAFTAGAGFGITYQHEDAYRFIITTDQNDAISITILRNDEATRAAKGTVGFKIDPGVTFNFTTKAGDALGAAAQHLCQHLPSGTSEKAATKLGTILKGASEDAVNKLAGIINDQVNELIKKPNGTGELQFLHENVKTDTALFRLHCTKGISEEAVQSALQGDIVAAVQAPGVTVDPGSAVEHAFIKRATIGLQVFNLCNWHDVMEYFDQVTVTYAGNGILRLAAKEGVTHISGIGGHESSCEVYFLAETARTLTNATVDEPTISLHFTLIDHNNDRAAETERLFLALNRPDIQGFINKAKNAIKDGKAILTTSCALPRDSFVVLRTDPDDGRRETTRDEDEHNYAVFVTAVNRVNGAFHGLPQYREWAELNVAANFQEGSRKPATRHNSGNSSSWPSKYNQFSSLDKSQRWYSTEGARHFMNLIEALEHLAQEKDPATEAGFTLLRTSLRGIIDKNVPPDFIKATLLALIILAGEQFTDIVPVAEGAACTITFAIATPAAMMMTAPKLEQINNRE